jgi:hypothetical protein
MPLMEALLSKEILSAMVIVSVVGFFGSLVAIPLILVRLPSHYFDERHPRKWMEHHHPALRLIGHVLKNVVGFVLLAAGIAMLVLPGQGILTMLIGIPLVDFPGKRQLERKLIGQPAVLNTINRVREKFGQPPLTVAHDL